jgi:GDP-L-fucose synthase
MSTSSPIDTAQPSSAEVDLSHHRVVVTGGHGFLGASVLDELRRQGAQDIYAPRRAEIDLLDPSAYHDLLREGDIVVHLAASVGGIGFNRDHPGRLFYDNIMMGTQLMEAARIASVSQFLTVGTICAYPKFTPVPFREEDLWIGYPEETNAPYGVAKKALLVMGQAYEAEYHFPARYVLPVNLYGPRDNFNPESSHVIPALIKKIYDAQQQKVSQVVCWGDGSPTREFLYVDDAARGIVTAARRLHTSEPVNLGTNEEISIRDLVMLIADLMEYQGEICWDTDKPNGQPRRCLSVERASTWIDWRAEMSFKDGLRRTIDWYCDHPLPISSSEDY